MGHDPELATELELEFAQERITNLEAAIEEACSGLSGVTYCGDFGRGDVMCHEECWQCKAAEAMEVLAPTGDEAADRITAEKNAIYNERNRVVAALAKLTVVLRGSPFCGQRTAGMMVDLAAESGWQNVVIIDYPTGQVSWHIPDEELSLFSKLPLYEGDWDGHTTEEKYDRLAGDL